MTGEGFEYSRSNPPLPSNSFQSIHPELPRLRRFIVPCHPILLNKSHSRDGTKIRLIAMEFRRKTMKNFLLTIFLGLGIVLPCQAGVFGRPCVHCGCCQLKKVCRLVPDVKKVTQFEYSVDEEEVCLLGKSCSEEQNVADKCLPNGRRCETVQTPRCGRIVCKKTLKKTTTTVEKSSVKCVVDTVCGQCGYVCNSGNCAR